MKRQKGISYLGIFFISLTVVLCAVLVVKVVPAYTEYFGLVKIINSMAASGELRGASPNEARVAFSKRVYVDNISVLGPNELEITREGHNMVISFAYSKKIPLFWNINLLIDYESSVKADASAR